MTVQALEAEQALRHQAVDDVEGYLALVQLRQQAGVPATDDQLRTRARASRARVELLRVGRALDEARVELCTLLGRAPEAALAVVPLAPPPPAPTTDWQQAPDLVAADRAVEAMAAAVAVARAGRGPQLDLELNAGAEPVLGPSFDAPANTGRGLGAEGLLTLSLPLWDHGLTRARIDQAQVQARMAGTQAEQARRQAHAAWAQAQAELRDLQTEQARQQELVPQADDAWLYAPSLYRGGQGSALDVLDALDTRTEVRVDAVQTTLDAWLAQARLHRWEQP